MYKASSTFSKAINYADDTAGWVRYRDIVDIINEEAEGRNKINAEVVEYQQNIIPTVTNEDIDKLFRVENETLNIGKPKGDKPIIGQDDVGNIPVESAFLLVYAADGDGQIIKIQTLDSPTQIFTSGKQFMVDNSKRESARWVEALDRLIEWGWVKALGYKGEIFELTGTGYNKADWLKDGMGIDTSKDPLDELKEFE
ncbi:hypothetical protein LI221_14805 [Faecalimonas umbilicata]|nr:hypothetical protein [Faecalimonas umbilicata]